jgi:hypothetical protein
MACNDKQTLVFNGIKGKQIDIAKIPNLPIFPAPADLKTWYINSGQIVQYSVVTGEGIYITYNYSPTGCDKNPIVSCDPCISVTGTITDAEINEALGKLPFKSGGDMGILALMVVGIGVLYLTTRKK